MLNLKTEADEMSPACAAEPSPHDFSPHADLYNDRADNVETSASSPVVTPYHKDSANSYHASYSPPAAAYNGTAATSVGTVSPAASPSRSRAGSDEYIYKCERVSESDSAAASRDFRDSDMDIPRDNGLDLSRDRVGLDLSRDRSGMDLSRDRAGMDLTRDRGGGDEPCDQAEMDISRGEDEPSRDDEQCDGSRDLWEGISDSRSDDSRSTTSVSPVFKPRHHYDPNDCKNEPLPLTVNGC